jgi:hypothetical protein
MYTTLNMANIFRNNRVFCIIILVSFQLIFFFELKAQNKQITELAERKQNLIDNYLLPSYNENTYKEVVRFIVEPPFTHPEYTIRLFNGNDCSKMELVSFKKSLTDQLMKRLIENNKDAIFDTNTVNRSVCVSDNVSNQIINLVEYLINSRYCKYPVDEIPLDGTFYSFFVFSKNDTTFLRFHASEQNILRQKVVKLFCRMAYDIENKNINEKVIIDSIDEILE